MISIVIALYKEAENVTELTNRIYNTLDGIPFELIYCIDDVETYNKAKKLKVTGIVLDYSPIRRGFKNACFSGFKLARGDYILTLDGDLNHAPEDIPKLLIHHEDIIIGSRYVSGGGVNGVGYLRLIVSVFANKVINLLLKTNEKDKTSGYRLYKKKALTNILPHIKSSGFECLFEILYMAKKLNYSIREVPITLTKRKYGKSKFNLLRTGLNYFKLICRVISW